MQQWLDIIAETMTDTVVDVLPIVLIMGFFQVVILRERIPNLGRVITGSICVVLGLGLFLVGLEQALFPLGKEMARQLSDPSFLEADHPGVARGAGPGGGLHRTVRRDKHGARRDFDPAGVADRFGGRGDAAVVDYFQDVRGHQDPAGVPKRALPRDREDEALVDQHLAALDGDGPGVAAGNVSILADTLVVADFGIISSSTFAGGAGSETGRAGGAEGLGEHEHRVKILGDRGWLDAFTQATDHRSPTMHEEGNVRAEGGGDLREFLGRWRAALLRRPTRARRSPEAEASESLDPPGEAQRGPTA